MVSMARMAAFRFSALDDPVLTEAVRRHIGARRFAYKRCLQAVKDTLDERRARPKVEVPWSGFSLINWWNGPDPGKKQEPAAAPTA
jgi:putative transposase